MAGYHGSQRIRYGRRKVASHLCLKPEQVQSAIHYYKAYPAEIDQALEENNIGEERLQQMFPNLRVFTFPAQDEEQPA